MSTDLVLDKHMTNSVNQTLIDRKFSTCLLSRRVKAYQHMGLDTIPARVIDIDSILVGEYSEIEVRKDFTHSELG